MIQLKRARENFDLVFARQIIGLLERQREPRFVEFSARVFLDLHAERGHDVEGGVKFRRFLQHAHHAPVILEGVQPRPREHVAAGFRIAILRLMHVPQQARDGCDSSRAPRPLPDRCSCYTHRFSIMRILDRYIVREVFRHALLGLVVFTFVFFVPQLVRLTALFVRHTGSGSQIAELFLCIFPGVLTFTIPMAILIGVLLGLGRMSSGQRNHRPDGAGHRPAADSAASRRAGGDRCARDAGDDAVAGTARAAHLPRPRNRAGGLAIELRDAAACLRRAVPARDACT